MYEGAIYVYEGAKQIPIQYPLYNIFMFCIIASFYLPITKICEKIGKKAFVQYSCMGRPDRLSLKIS